MLRESIYMYPKSSMQLLTQSLTQRSFSYIIIEIKAWMSKYIPRKPI